MRQWAPFAVLVFVCGTIFGMFLYLGLDLIKKFCT